MIDVENLLNYALSLSGAEHEYKSTWEADLIKVHDKIFLLMHTHKNGELYMSLKCDPNRAIDLREQYEFIIPGFHLNKKHWNTIIITHIDNCDEMTVCQYIKNSYNLVVDGLPRSLRDKINNLEIQL